MQIIDSFADMFLLLHQLDLVYLEDKIRLDRGVLAVQAVNEHDGVAILGPTFRYVTQCYTLFCHFSSLYILYIIY